MEAQKGEGGIRVWEGVEAKGGGGEPEPPRSVKPGPLYTLLYTVSSILSSDTGPPIGHTVISDHLYTRLYMYQVVY
jgi:hypothetical protein